MVIELALDDHALHAPDRQHEAEVLAERRLTVDGQHAEVRQRLDHALIARDVEELGEPPALLHLCEQHALAALRERHRERGRDGALADAALPDHEQHPTTVQRAEHDVATLRHGRQLRKAHGERAAGARR